MWGFLGGVGVINDIFSPGSGAGGGRAPRRGLPGARPPPSAPSPRLLTAPADRCLCLAAMADKTLSLTLPYVV